MQAIQEDAEEIYIQLSIRVKVPASRLGAYKINPAVIDFQEDVQPAETPQVEREVSLATELRNEKLPSVLTSPSRRQRPSTLYRASTLRGPRDKYVQRSLFERVSFDEAEEISDSDSNAEKQVTQITDHRSLETISRGTTQNYEPWNSHVSSRAVLPGNATRFLPAIRSISADEAKTSRSAAFLNAIKRTCSNVASWRNETPVNSGFGDQLRNDSPMNISKPVKNGAFSRFPSLRHFKKNDFMREEMTFVDRVDEEPEIASRPAKGWQNILEELIKTEVCYVDNLLEGLVVYGGTFERKDLPLSLRGKKYDLFGNIEQIAAFHRDEFLPMLYRTRHDLRLLFTEFLNFVKENKFYCYIDFTMNKKRSLQLQTVHANYFEYLRFQADDKLGMGSFMMQPILRMTKYPLLLQQFIATLFKSGDFSMKPAVETCCRLEKSICSLLTTINEADVVNEIVVTDELFSVASQGKFRKADEFAAFDYTSRRAPLCKLLLFEKSVVCTEITDKGLVCLCVYPFEQLDIVSKPKTFVLYNRQTQRQDFEFSGDTAQVKLWVNLIRNTMNNADHLRSNHHLHSGSEEARVATRENKRCSDDSGISLG